MKRDYPPQHIIEEQLASWCHPLLFMSFNYYIWIMKLNNIMQISRAEKKNYVRI
jgi:hypothetical protein